MEKSSQLINLSATIRREMIRKGLSQAELGRRAGVRIATISEFLNGKKEIQTGNLERLLSTLNAKVIFLKNQIKYGEPDNNKKRFR